MIATIRKKFRFESAHYVPFHEGKCRRMHGHSYVIEVFARGEVVGIEKMSSESGMVVDFYRLGDAWKLIEAKLDHYILNNVIKYPTAEVLAAWFLTAFNSIISEVFKVRVHETAEGFAEVTFDHNSPVEILDYLQSIIYQNTTLGFPGPAEY